MRRLALCTSLFALALAGCSGGGSATESASATASTSQSVSASAGASESASASAPASPEPAPAAPGGGESVPVGSPRSNEFIVSTVEEVKANTALVRTCIVVMPPGMERMSFDWTTWSMVGADGTQYPAKVGAGTADSPAYPNGEGDGTFGPSECAHGWITFNIPGGAQVAAVRHQEQGASPWVWSIN